MNRDVLQFCIDKKVDITIVSEHRRKLIYSNEKTYKTDNGIFKIGVYSNLKYHDNEHRDSRIRFMDNMLQGLDNLCSDDVNIIDVPDMNSNSYELYFSKDDFEKCKKYFLEMKLKY